MPLRRATAVSRSATFSSNQLAPALLAALVATHTLANGHHIQVGPSTAGVLIAAVVMHRTRSIAWCVLSAAVVTALLRAL